MRKYSDASMPQKINVGFVLGLSPEVAVKYLKSKGYAFSFDWFEIWQEAHNRAFTVAKVMRLDILQTIRKDVEKALADGLTFEEFRSSLEPRLKALGWWGRQDVIDPNTGSIRNVMLGSPHRLETIYRTNLNVAYAVGRHKEMEEVTDYRPYWRYVCVVDANTRANHLKYHNKVFRYSDPIWKLIYPPNDWECRCSVENLTAAEVSELGLTVSKGTEISKKDIKESIPDEWRYNPAETAFVPDLSKYDKDIAEQYE